MIPPVYSELSADAATTALVSTRIFQSRRPPASGAGSDLPCITFRVISGAPNIHMDSEAGLDFLRTQIDCWAADADVARQIARAVKDKLSATGHITYNGDDYDKDTRTFRWSLDWLYWHDPS